MIPNPVDRSGSSRQVVHAVMLNWNSYDHNAACIASLRTSRYPFAKIIVVDNGSTDGSIDRLEREFHDGHILFVRNARNEGFAGGMNKGFLKALDLGATMVFSINNDTIVDPDCLGHLVAALEQDEHAGIAGPAIMFHGAPDTIWQAGGAFNRLRAGVVVPAKGKHVRELSQGTQRATFLTGCAILIRASVIEKVGLLDTSYFFYGEDIDYDLRVLGAGFHLLLVPPAKVWHKIEEVAKDRTSPYVLYHLARSTAMLYRKRFTGPYRWYGIGLQFLLYTPFRFWQIAKGRAGGRSAAAWIRGLLDGASGADVSRAISK